MEYDRRSCWGRWCSQGRPYRLWYCKVKSIHGNVTDLPSLFTTSALTPYIMPINSVSLRWPSRDIFASVRQPPSWDYWLPMLIHLGGTHWGSVALSLYSLLALASLVYSPLSFTWHPSTVPLTFLLATELSLTVTPFPVFISHTNRGNLNVCYSRKPAAPGNKQDPVLLPKCVSRPVCHFSSEY